MSTRTLERKVRALATQDGDGVKIKRVGGRMMQQHLNPFLMVDEINSDDAADYIGGFPSHPHRGFETITYMKAGRMRHRDHMGNEGVIGPGDVQWMTAARGVIHSETPEQEDGLLHGFQLWLNLPSSEKMKPAAYHEFSHQDIPAVELANGGSIKVVAGDIGVSHREATSTIQGALPEFSTQPVFLDVMLAPHERVSLNFNSEYRAQVYVYDGNTTVLKQSEMGLFSPGEVLELESTETGAGMLVLSGRPINEPIAQYGPFVMNTQEELQQAFMDYQNGTLAS